MGVVRFAVECPGCQSGILLRLGVGHDRQQPFFYVCPKCYAATRGALVWSGGATTSLQLTAGRLLSTKDHTAYTIHINPEIPSVPDASDMGQPGGSAFMMFVQMVGFDRMQAFQARTDALRAILKNDWPTMQRLTTYYLNRDWHHFDRDAKALVPAEHQKFKAEWHRDHVLHHLYDLLFIPLLALDGVGRYPLMKQSWNELWTPKGRHYDRLVAFAKSSVTTPSFIASQRDLFTNIDRYVTLLSALLPGLLCNMLRREDDPVIDSLRLFRDDYELLRDFYIQSYETCHKTLRWVIGAANADHSGSWDKFAIPPGVTDIKKVPADLDAFDKVVNAEKRKWLACIPEWNLHWDFVFDRSLRNDIGHASAYHELASGNILRGKKNPLPYTRYVARVQQTLHGLLAALNVLKILRVYSFA